jgi:hypothetical protein
MDGQIAPKSSVTIGFKRKELTLENFNMIQNNPGQFREKFLIELSCEVEDSVGIMQKKERVAMMGVTFTRAAVEEATTKIENISWDDGKVRKDRPAEKKVEVGSSLSQKVLFPDSA